MRVGIDLDNTIINYENVFYQIALEEGIIEQSIERSKNSVKKAIIDKHGEERWTELQGVVYGKKITKAIAYDSVMSFMKICKERGAELFIVSHKTKFPYLGEKVDLHTSALTWLESNGFFEELLNKEKVFFRLTKDEKVNKIVELKLDLFIDDLEEILTHKSFPNTTIPIYFNKKKSDNLINYSSWNQIIDKLLMNEH